MKSYQEWQFKKTTDDYYQTVILPQVIEWSIHNPLGGRSMSPQETAEMERVGRMFGYNKGWWNIFKQDSRHGGDNATSELQQIIAMPDDNQKNAALAKWVNSSGKVSQNAPFKQAYDRINTIKMQVNKRDAGGLRADQIQWLVDVLKNSHKGGNVPYKTIQDLWYVVTGITDGKNVCQDCKDAALHNDVHTPWHLMRYLFGVGGGFFAEPSNKKEITQGSSNALKQFYPEKYNELLHGGQSAPTQQAQDPGDKNAAAVAGAVGHEQEDDDDEDLANPTNSTTPADTSSGSTDPNQHFSDLAAGRRPASLDDFLNTAKSPAEREAHLDRMIANLNAAKAGKPKTP